MTKKLSAGALYHQALHLGCDQAKTDFETTKTHMQGLVPQLKERGRAGQLDLVESAFWKKDIPGMQDIATQYKRFHNILVLGNGQVTLGGAALTSLYQSWVMGGAGGPYIYYVNAPDAEIFWELMSFLNPQTTGVLVLSESGESDQTLILLMRCIEYWRDLLTPDEIKSHFTVVSPKNSMLGRLAEEMAFHFLDYPVGVPGQFSALTMAGLLPLMLMGGNIDKVRKGAQLVTQDLFAGGDSQPLLGASFLMTLYKKGVKLHGIAPQGDAFQAFSLWLQQAILASLCHKGEGVAPLLFPYGTDLEGQVAVASAGPAPMALSLFFEETRPQERPHPSLWKRFSGLEAVSESTIAQLHKAKTESFKTVLVQNGVPLRFITAPVFNEYAMGGLLAHVMLEVLLVAEALGIDALSRKAVPALPFLTQRFLKQDQLAKAKHAMMVAQPKTTPKTAGAAPKKVSSGQGRA